MNVQLMIDIKRRYHDMPKAAKAALWFTFCNFFVTGLSFLTAPIFTRLLPPEEYGTLTLYVTYEQIIIIVATWEIQLGAYQKGLFKYDNWSQYSQSTLLLINLLSIAFYIFVVIFYKSFYSFTLISFSTLTLLFIYTLFSPAYICWTTRKRTEYEYIKVVGMSILYSLCNIVIPLFSIILIKPTAIVKYNATLITSIVLFVYFYVTTIIKKDERLKWSTIKPQWIFMLIYEAPLVLHSLSYLVLGQADRVMIGKMVGERQAAFYGVAYTLASAVTILQSSLNQALTPWRFQKLKERDYKIINTNTNFLLIIMGGAILFVVLIAPEIMKLLFTKSYFEAVWSIPPVAISVFFMFLYSSFVSIESYYEKTKYIMYVSVACGLVNIGLNYLLIPVLGYIVCGYTTLFSYILFATLHYLCMRRVCKKLIPGVSIFSLWSIVLISIGVVCVSVLITIFYPNWMIRYGMLFALIILAFTYRAKIKGKISLLNFKKI